MQGRRAAGGLMDSATAVAYTGPRFAVTGAASIRAAQPFDPAPLVPKNVEATDSLVSFQYINGAQDGFRYPSME